MSSNWQSPTNSASPANAFANLSLKPSPLSSRTASPAAQSGAPNGAKKPAGDSFANIAPFGKKQTNNLSLLEQQQLREAQRRKDEEERQKQMDQLFGGGGGANTTAGFWDGLEGKSKPAPSLRLEDDDILAGFSAATPVDNASYYPPPRTDSQPKITPRQAIDPMDDLFGNISGNPVQPAPVDGISASKPPQSQVFDPFDIDSLSSRGTTPNPPPQSAPRTQIDDEFDILGDLAKPVSEVPPRPQPSPSPTPTPQSSHTPEPSAQRDDPRDSAVAEIVDMGFSAEQAREALAQTQTGLDVEAAIGYILDQAHRKTKSQRSTPQNPSGSSSRRNDRSREPPQHRGDADDDVPAWARSGTQSATAIGGTFLKSANSLWNAGRKKVEKAVAEFQADLKDDGGDPSMPRWMRERQIREQLEARGARGITHNDRPPKEPQPEAAKEQAITDEALMLEMGTGPPQPRKKTRDSPALSAVPQSRSAPPSGLSQREQIQLQRQQAFEAAIREKERELQERQQRARNASAIPDSASRRAQLEAEPETQYVSRNRRRPPPASSSSKTSTPAPAEGDLLSGSKVPAPRSNNPFAQEAAIEKSRSPQPQRPQQAQQRFQSRSPAPPRRATPPPPRTVPSVSPSSLAASNAARQKGTDAFKLGDYTLAQQHYTSSLTPIPDAHPLRIILLTNRSLSHIKLGDPRSALADITEILNLIGPLKGANETISIDATEKPMADYWSKAVIRKAECLEQLEKWVDAKAAWEDAIAAGVGGAQANAGKRRCENAINPPPKPQPRPASAAPSSSGSSARRRPPPPRSAPPAKSAGDHEAVRALRAQNAASDKAEAEKFALHDSVETRINAWKNGKEGNLRALLAGLDTVLWEGAGWKKVGMGELLMPNKCKIWYMKGIGKVHPDKIPQTATTEQRMISAAVFSLLNEAWDAFKAENGL